MFNRSQGAYLLLLVLLLALVTACGAEPTPTSVARIATLVPTFTPTARPTATHTPTPLPTSSPSPSPSPTVSATVTPTFTDTPFPTHTATPTPSTMPTATPTASATSVSPTPRPTPKPKPPTATPQPGDGFDFDITMQRMLSIEENGGVVGNHNIYVHVYDANGRPLNGVVICRVYALQLQPPDPHACGVSGETGEGRMHFDVYAGDIIYVASADPSHRPRSPYSRPLEQEPAAMTNLQELVDNGYCASVEDCQARIPINNLVRFHYSYEVHFQRRW